MGLLCQTKIGSLGRCPVRLCQNKGRRCHVCVRRARLVIREKRNRRRFGTDRIVTVTGAGELRIIAPRLVSKQRSECRADCFKTKVVGMGRHTRLHASHAGCGGMSGWDVRCRASRNAAGRLFQHNLHDDGQRYRKIAGCAAQDCVKQSRRKADGREGSFVSKHRNLTAGSGCEVACSVAEVGTGRSCGGYATRAG